MDSVVDDPDLPMDYETSPWGSFGRSLTLGFVSLCSKFVMQVMNTTSVHNGEIYIKATTQRDRGLGLITVSNHTSTIDDPALHCALLPASFFFTEHNHGNNRWVTCAEEMCFRNEFLKQFFMTGKTLPVKRGAGVDQPVMTKLSQLVKKGHWVHVFPEGRVSYTGSLQGLKWGVGKIICDSVENGNAPMVVPFYHTGMEQVMPKKARFPRMNKQIRIFIGDLVDLHHLVCKCNETENPQQTWSEITLEIEKALRSLESQALLHNKKHEQH
eukprot:g6041.t1